MISISQDLHQRLDSALNDGKTLTAAYVDTRGKPHISFYGSTHVHEPDKLAIWVRNPESDLIQAIPIRPDIAFIYGDIGDRFYAKFEGTARIETNHEIRQRVYDEMHPVERQFDPDMSGIAVVIDLHTLTVQSGREKEISTA